MHHSEVDCRLGSDKHFTTYWLIQEWRARNAVIMWFMSIVSALHTCCIHLDIDSVTFKLMYAYVQIKRWLAAVIFQLTETKFERNIIMNTLTRTEINVMTWKLILWNLIQTWIKIYHWTEMISVFRSKNAHKILATYVLFRLIWQPWWVMTFPFHSLTCFSQSLNHSTLYQQLRICLILLLVRLYWYMTCQHCFVLQICSLSALLRLTQEF
jgi:hypothetical protein